MATATKSNVQVRVDTDLKKDAESIFDNLGVDTPTAIRIFLKKVVATRSIPFNLEESPYVFTKEEEQEILNACDPDHEDSETVAVTTSAEETQAFLDSLKS